MTTAAVMAETLTPTMGAWRERTHCLPVRVYYEDTDAAGIVYHANYLRFAERGRTEMLRTLGVELSQLREATGLLFVLREGDVRYRKPARLDDTLIVETALLELGAASLLARQIIRRRDGTAAEEELVRFNAQLACTNRAGKPVRIPRAIREKLKAFLSEF